MRQGPGRGQAWHCDGGKVPDRRLKAGRKARWVPVSTIRPCCVPIYSAAIEISPCRRPFPSRKCWQGCHRFCAPRLPLRRACACLSDQIDTRRPARPKLRCSKCTYDNLNVRYAMDNDLGADHRTSRQILAPFAGAAVNRERPHSSFLHCCSLGFQSRSKEAAEVSGH